MIYIIFLLLLVGICIVFGFSFGLIFLVGLLLYISIWLYLRGISKKYPRLTYIRHLMLAAFVVWLVSFIIVEGFVISGGNADKDLKGEYLLVLGAGIRGETPSVSLKSRLDKAVEFLNTDKNIKVIVSGGQGDGENITEAEAMKRYLIKAGVNENLIIKEEKSTSTKENLIFSKSIINELGNDEKYKIVLITSDFHIFRTKILANRVGLDISVLPADTPITIYIIHAIREYFALIKTLLE